MSDLPIQFKEIVQLPTLGVNPAAIGFATLTMESEKYICVRDVTGTDKTVTIIDLLNPSNILRRPTAAEGTTMNPAQNILALRDAQNLQIIDLGNKKPVNSCTISESIEFWKWITDTKLGIVTATSVYHWSLEAEAKPIKVFARHQSLAGSQIINYRVDSSEQWCCLIGISKQEERIVGAMQLYSVERKISQPLEGHAAAFANFQVEGSPKPSTLFCFASRSAQSAKLYAFEVGNPTEVKYQKKQTDIYFPAEASADFPVAMQVSDRYGVVYMITKFGYIHIFDLGSAKLLYMNRISSDTIFVTAPQQSNGGIIGVNRRGQVLSITLDENNVIQYICTKLNDYDLALKLASRCGFDSARDLFAQQFNSYLSQGRYKEAAKVAADSPKGFLRTIQTIQRFQQLPAMGTQAPPLLQYFSVLLELGKLNKLEAVELCRPVLMQNKKELIQNWLKEDKLECSEELGNLILPHDPALALSVFYLAGTHDKVIQCLAETNQYDRIVPYCQKVGHTPDGINILHTLIQTNPPGAVGLALKLLTTPELAQGLDINQVVDLFMQRNMVQETTSLLLDVLKRNLPSDAQLQTRLLEINLIQAPQVADAILGKEWFTHYNRQHIASLCEKAGLYQRALEHYTDLADMRRMILQASRAISPEFLVGYFAKLNPDDSLALLRDLLRQDPRGNLNLVVQVAIKYSEAFEASRLIDLFESFHSSEGLYQYLNSIVNSSQDPTVHFAFIEAAAKTNHLKDVERVCRESNFYDPEKVKNFLKDARLPDQLPLIIVCDRFDMVEDLTQYLYKNNMQQFIEGYVQKINSMNTPAVVGALIDVDCNEEYIKNLIMSVRSMCPVEELVEQVEKRNRLRILLPWLEARIAEGNTESATHDALMKIYIDNNNNAEKHLQTNQFYDSRIVGRYCENRDPHLAYIVYKRGLCDDELVAVTNKNSLFKLQARYLVERQSPELWSKVLAPSNEHRKAVIDQVVQTALPESKSAEEVSSAVQALMVADMPNELIELLEKLVLDTHGGFSNNKNLQNLLLVTAIRNDPSKVMKFIGVLDKYDAADIANIAITSGLFNEAFEMFSRKKLNGPAIRVLLDNLEEYDRAAQFADVCKEPEVYSALAEAQLRQNNVKDAIESYVKANDPSNYMNVIVGAERESLWEPLVKFLHMCRTRVKEAHIESELIYALAKTNKLAELEEFITGPNCAQIALIGDRCFDEGLFEAAKLLFNNINNFARLATTLVKLQQYSSAVEAARKANSIKTWKEVNLHLVDAREFRLAQLCALHIVIHGDELDELIRQYEQRGFFDELISVLENSLGSDRNHSGMFTELAVLYSKYKPEKLEEYLRLFYGRFNSQKVLRIIEQNQQWKDLTWLLKADKEFSNAATVMIEHPIEAWDHAQFKDVIALVPNVDIYYKALKFYLRDHPLQTTELLKVVAPKIDHTRVVSIARQEGDHALALIKPYLASVQHENIASVNEALNELHTEDEDYEALRNSVDNFDKFDNIGLAHRLEKHELLEFRRIAATLYKRNNQWEKSIQLSKQDNLYTDAMKTAAESADLDSVEGLLRFFVDQGLRECFAACLYTCYDLVRPDVVMELAWKHGLTDYAMPYLIQVIKEYTTRIEKLEKANKDRTAAAAGPAGTVGGPQSTTTLSAPTSVSFDAAASSGFAPVMIDPFTGMPLPVGVLPTGGVVPPQFSTAGLHMPMPLPLPMSVPMPMPGAGLAAPLSQPHPHSFTTPPGVMQHQQQQRGSFSGVLPPGSGGFSFV
eukprot:TRINITY_DN2768_c0_g2_i1.p1 TRINITY_DN2768_c0_g2~~TRINITY_DN2768_c0_g2_i1.p1  ORF type:complete len:1757 (+),score=359.13 TRINITY_DN2768_c0_g2_i1:174-5444(+)